ncbi:uncharacterized protein LOC110706770 [Chenopodium quinoa]|uniref:uncharacterized protein LOC110706770 n=1 Tax=Chenopodium quinoa TaxID=63459 RepID=UPI000B775B09|nr:uncharacterized protein LOC110706770 [Chenopodium quinoa]
MAQGNMIDVRTKKYDRTGPKPREFSYEFLQSVPLYLRQNERSYAVALKISHVTLHNLKKKGRLRTHTSSNKLALTSDHKVARLKWVLLHINPITVDEDPTFVDMNHVIHIDEKWFYLNPDKRKFYLLPMKELAKKSSKNTPAGTWVTKALQNVNREVIREMLLTKVILAIKSKWPESLPKNVIIQWDNVRPHQVLKDEEFIAATTSNGVNIQLVFQPAQSPDLNV